MTIKLVLFQKKNKMIQIKYYHNNKIKFKNKDFKNYKIICQILKRTLFVKI